MSEQPRDWDRELADIDRAIAKQGSVPQGGAPLPAPVPAPPSGSRAQVPGVAAPVRRRSVALTWFWVLLALALAAALALWPYQRSCGLQLIFFLGAAGVRNARHGGELPPDEARAGAASLSAAIEEMGWVLWLAAPGDYFIGSSSPLHVAFPKEDASQTTGFDVSAPQVEVTFALSPRVALHATWRRRGELWRRSRQEVTLEINGRTCAGASAYLFSPQPAVPG